MKVSHSQDLFDGLTHEDPRWTALRLRDHGADGKFVYSVKTTGVYCRPSCPSRQARPENVRFHLTCDEAEMAGFRPCKRCKPRDAGLVEQRATLIAKTCKLIESSESMPSLKMLAEHVGLSEYHFHRLFKMVTGLTPRDYGHGHRAKSLRRALTRSSTITDAVYEAGYGSSARVYEGKVLGMTPSAYRNGGKDTDIRFAIGECSMGAILVARSQHGVCAISLGDDPDALVRALQDRFPQANLIANDAAFEELVAKVVGLIEAPKIGIELPLDVRGTAFQQRVWQALQRIPAGTTLSYSELAARIGRPTAVRAVGTACASNIIAVAIPCHRVVRQNGDLSGYRWGVERKRELLDRESR